MAKKGLCYVGFAPLQYKAHLTSEGSAPIDPYDYNNNDEWLVKDGQNYYRYGYAITTAGGTDYQDMASNKPLFHVSPSVTFNGSTANNSAKDYGDDVVQESDMEFSGGTLSIELNNDINLLYAMLFKYDVTLVDSVPAEIEFNVDDPIPYVGVGAIGRSGDEYVAKWYPLVRFRLPNDDNQTKQESVTFGHVTVEGDIFQTRFGIWKQRKVFSSLSDAKTWLNNRTKKAAWYIED